MVIVASASDTHTLCDILFWLLDNYLRSNCIHLIHSNVAHKKKSYFQMDLVHSPAVFTLVNVNCTHGSRLRKQLMRLPASENDDQSKWLHWHNYVEREQCAGALCKNGPISLIYARFEFWVSINFLAFLSISRSPDHAERFVSDIEYGIEEKCLYSIENRISTHIITKTSQRPQFANSFLSHFFLVLKLSESD